MLFNDTEDVAGIQAAYHQVSNRLAGTPGLQGNELLHSVLEPTGFVVVSTWRSMEAFQAWEQGAGHREETAPLRPFRDLRRGNPFGIYEVTAAYHNAATPWVSR